MQFSGPEEECVDRNVDASSIVSGRVTPSVLPATQSHGLIGRWNAIRALSVPCQLEAYAEIAQSSLSQALLASQRNAALRWMSFSSQQSVQELLQTSASSHFIATQAISSVTPSRIGAASVNAIEKGNAIEISGVSAWVTGVTQCAYITLGVERHDGLQAVALVRRDAAGVSVLPHQRLGILQDSDTGEVRFNQVTVDKDALLIPFGPDVITKHAGVAVRGYPPLTTAAICAGHALGTCNHVREVKNLPASLGAICNDYITRIAQVKSCIASLAACSNPVDHSSYESLRAEANVCAIRSADLLAIACRGGALIQGGLAEQRTLESRFFLTWAMSPGCQQKTLGQL